MEVLNFGPVWTQEDAETLQALEMNRAETCALQGAAVDWCENAGFSEPSLAVRQHGYPVYFRGPINMRGVFNA